MNDKPSPRPDDTEELAHADDRIIGKASRWSGFVLIVIALMAGVILFIVRRKPAPPPPKVTALSAPAAPVRSQAEIPVSKFADITRDAGIHFVHNNGARGEKLLPETMGSGVAFFDFDNDGDQDLLFVNGTAWPWHAAEGGKPTTSALYRNDGTGKFTDTTAGSGLDTPLYGMGIAVGDYDNDGLTDAFISTVGGGRLFHNLGGGKFKEVTTEAGVAGSTKDWSTASAWFDYDNDGRLDLLVANYVRWSREIDAQVGYTLVGVGRAYGPPMNFEGAFPRLYHNDGNGQFTEVTEKSGFQVKNPSTGVPAAKTLGIAPVDIDGDGWMDVVLANDTVPNMVFLNQRDGTFKEVGAISGIAFDSYGNTRGAMGIDTARFRNDATLGVVIGNFANEMTALYVSQRNRTNFVDEAIPEGVGPVSRLPLKFGVFFFDYDLDGWLDLLSINGHLEEEISKVQQSQKYAQSAQLLWNAGASKQGGFLPVGPDQAGADIFKPIVGRGSAFADIDGDGDLDTVFTQVAGPPVLLRNDQKADRHWVRLKLIGTKGNREAIGAWAEVRAGGQTQSRQVMPTRSYLSQSELPLTFGLGKTDRVEEVTVHWPGGEKQRLSAVPLDQTTTITQGQ